MTPDRDVDQETQRRLAWHTAAVSWGQLIIALATLLGVMVIDRLTFEKRITIVEERQAFAIAATIEINRKLEIIQNQLTAVLIEVTRNEANLQGLGLHLPGKTENGR